MALARKKKVPPTKYEILDRLLINFGNNIIDADRLWREMKAHGYGQNDIDWWCREYYAKENSKMLGNSSEGRRR
jgi:hypothetical protein